MENTPRDNKSDPNVSFYSSKSREQGKYNLIEISIFFVFSNIVFFSGILDSTLNRIIPNYYDSFFRIPDFSKSLILTVGVVIYTVIYGVSPIQLVINRLKNPDISHRGKKNSDDDQTNRHKDIEITPTEFKAATDSAEHYLKSLINSSQSLSKNIYNRGNLYLLIGLICSFSGIVFFYSQTHTIAPERKATEQILYLLPNFGVLFFLELVAFFFLKQYKTTMDEFRYYESIQRSREESLAIIKFTLESGKSVDLVEVLEKIKFSGNSGKLEAGESTEIIETRKLDKSELETLTKLVETVVSKIGQGPK